MEAGRFDFRQLARTRKNILERMKKLLKEIEERFEKELVKFRFGG